MYPFPPIYPEMPDCRRPCRPAPPEPCRICDLTPANVSATVLGVDDCGGIIIRVQRYAPDCECRRPKPCCR